MQLPYIPDEIFEVMHEFSVFLLKDDKHDLGYYRYYKRKGHYYMGKHSPNHPGMLHHWQVGMAGLIFAQLGGLLNLARNAVTSDEMIESMGEGELYDESTVIDLPENAVQEVPLPQLPNDDVNDEYDKILDLPMPQTQNSVKKQQDFQLTPIPSLPPLQKI